LEEEISIVKLGLLKARVGAIGVDDAHPFVEVDYPHAGLRPLLGLVFGSGDGGRKGREG
jgi:hypothetical protein